MAHKETAIRRWVSHYEVKLLAHSAGCNPLTSEHQRTRRLNLKIDYSMATLTSKKYIGVLYQSLRIDRQR